MAISVQCPGCIRKLNVKDELAGKRVRCHACKEPIRIPLPPDDEGPDDPSGNRLLWPWVVAGVSGLLFAIALAFALANHSSARSARESLASAEQKVQEVTTVSQDLQN